MPALRTPGASRSRAGLRAVGVGQAVVGAALAARPDQVTRAVCAGARSAPPIWIVRILGLRQLAQAAVLIVRPTPTVALAGAAVDASHAASMVWVAARMPRYRRVATVSGGLATLSAAAASTTAVVEPRST